MSTEGKSKIKVTVESQGETTIIEREAAFVVAFDDNDGDLEIASALIGSFKTATMGEAIASAVYRQDDALGAKLSKAVSKTMALISLKDIIESMGNKECDCPKCRAEREAEGQ